MSITLPPGWRSTSAVNWPPATRASMPMTCTAASAGVTVPLTAMWSSRVVPPLLGASSLSLTRGSRRWLGRLAAGAQDEAGGEDDDQAAHRLTG